MPRYRLTLYINVSCFAPRLARFLRSAINNDVLREVNTGEEGEGEGRERPKQFASEQPRLSKFRSSRALIDLTLSPLPPPPPPPPLLVSGITYGNLGNLQTRAELPKFRCCFSVKDRTRSSMRVV